MYIEKINGPQDVKKFSIDELNALASEMRDALLHRASVHGGHFGPNFGIVEATIALHMYLIHHRTSLYLMFHTSHILIKSSQAEKRHILHRSITMM